jgi:hypothetical protein
MADSAAMPDVRELADAIAIAFDDLRALPRPGEAESDDPAPEGVVSRATKQLTGKLTGQLGSAASNALKGALKGAVAGVVQGSVTSAVKGLMGQAMKSAVSQVTGPQRVKPRAAAPVKKPGRR